MKTMETSEELESKISELENERNVLYDDLKRTLENSSNEISSISENISDPEIRRLVNEMEIQKTVLLCNLKTLKLREESSHSFTYKTHLPNGMPECSPSVNQNKEVLSIPATSGLHQLRDLDTTDKAVLKDEHKRLEDEICRLEQERELLLLQLQSFTSMRSSTVTEQQLQTQSELHSTFMQEESSHEVVMSPNYDDATNQLYADEEARLEQRIKELENENARIKRELDGILTEIQNDKTEMSQLQFTGQMLKERIEELEHKNRELDKNPK